MGLHLSLYASSDGHDGHPGHSLSHTRATVGHQPPFTFWWTRFDKPYPGGLTAVYGGELTRAGVFQALDNRQIYANSDHGRPILYFTINGTAAGGDSLVMVPEAGSAREIEIFLAQDGNPAAGKNMPATAAGSRRPDWRATVEIHKNGDLLAAVPVSRPVVSVKYTDTAPVTGTAYGPEKCVFRDGAYFINDYSSNPVNPATLNTGGRDFYIVRIVGNNGRHTYIGPIWVQVSP